MDGDKCIGAIVCKLDLHKNMIRRGYIAMLAVEKEYRRHKPSCHFRSAFPVGKIMGDTRNSTLNVSLLRL